MRFEVSARSMVGRRSGQEDSFRVFDKTGTDLTARAADAEPVTLDEGALVLIADGMGGEGGGRVASTTVADAFCREYFRGDGNADIPPRISRALQEANNALAATKVGDDLPTNAGTTLIAGVFSAGFLTFVSVGDSLLLRFRDDEVHRVNADHENGPQLDFRALLAGTPEAWSLARKSELRRHIASAVLGRDMAHVQLAVRHVLIDDVTVFASDGLETLSMENLRRFVPHLAANGGTAQVAQGLLDAIAAINDGHQDNTTILVVRALPNAGGGDGAATVISRF